LASAASVNTNITNNSDNQVSEIFFEIMLLECINHFKAQNSIQPYIDAGLDPGQAYDIVQRLLSDKLISMGEMYGKRVTMRLLEQFNVGVGVQSGNLGQIGQNDKNNQININGSLGDIRGSNQGFGGQVSSQLGTSVMMSTNSSSTSSAVLLSDPFPLQFLSNQVWSYLFGKQVDFFSNNQLQTNTQNSSNVQNNLQNDKNKHFQHNFEPNLYYILRENSLKFLTRFSPSVSNMDDIVKPYVWFVNGIIKGTLFAMGIEVEVVEDIELRKDNLFIIFKIFPTQTVIKSM